MKKYSFYLKNSALFLTGELFIVFICSLLNIIGLSTSITTIVLLVLNISFFIFLGFNNGNRSMKKGYLTGFITGLILILLLYLVNILFLQGEFNINQFIYYLILILSSTFGGMIGKAKKKEEN